MTNFRFIPLAVALASATVLVACNTAPAMPMGAASATGMAAPDAMARMDAQMKTMRDMHEKMMNAKSAQERDKLRGEHMKTMQDGMDMMGGMSPGGMGARPQMMEKRMDMMQMMMKMMTDQMPATPSQ